MRVYKTADVSHITAKLPVDPLLYIVPSTRPVSLIAPTMPPRLSCGRLSGRLVRVLACVSYTKGVGTPDSR